MFEIPKYSFTTTLKVFDAAISVSNNKFANCSSCKMFLTCVPLNMSFSVLSSNNRGKRIKVLIYGSFFTKLPIVSIYKQVIKHFCPSIFIVRYANQKKIRKFSGGK